jgi:acylphosphatase
MPLTSTPGAFIVKISMDTQQGQNLDLYIDNLIDQKGFKDLTPEVREELRTDIRVRLNDFIMARVIAAFSDEDVEKFEELLKQNKSQAELQQFAVDHIPNFTAFLTDVLIEFQGVYLGVSNSTAN